MQSFFSFLEESTLKQDKNVFLVSTAYLLCSKPLRTFQQCLILERAPKVAFSILRRKEVVKVEEDETAGEEKKGSS